jgi:pimeloyl-ACP methyl ester carboxylesterase
VLLHGFLDTWRTWELVLPALERRFEVLAPTLAGHAGGPPLGSGPAFDALLDAAERALDDAGLETAHLAGNSLGGYVALHLAARGRARSAVALAPAGGWARGDEAFRETMAQQRTTYELCRAAAPHADQLMATEEGRRRATRHTTVRWEHVPPALLAHQLRGVARCDAVAPLQEHALRHGWHLDAERIECPVRIVWGTEDAVLPWPRAAARYREEWLPHADWVVLDGVGHSPQLDVPLEAAELIAGHAGG